MWVRVQARGASAEAVAATLAAAESSLVEVLGADCYGRDDERLEQVVGRLLLERRLTLSVAESCTGGLVGDRLTNVAGSSAYFERGVVAYSNRAKQRAARRLRGGAAHPRRGQRALRRGDGAEHLRADGQ